MLNLLFLACAASKASAHRIALIGSDMGIRALDRSGEYGCAGVVGRRHFGVRL